MTTEDIFRNELKIPKERIAVLIGINGKEKSKLEERTNTTISIDSKEGDVIIEGQDALSLYSCREIVRSIARGFNPDVANLLLKQDYGLEVINILDFAKSKNDLIRLKGRLIGEKGKSRNTIEELSGAGVSVYGKTVSLIGDYEGLHIARRAVEMILQGSAHRNVYKWMEKQKKNLIKRSLQE